MKKHPRVINLDEMGGGSGIKHWESKYFRTVHMRLRDGDITKIECKLGGFGATEIALKGFVDFNNNEDCVSQFTSGEVMKLFVDVEKHGIAEGKDHKIREIQKVLGI